MERKLKHLEMLQNIICRMANNSFLLKGWTVTLVVGLFAFANVKEMEPKFMILALLPTISFWILDGFFLHQEWLFRALYNYTTTLDEDNIDFLMDPTSFNTKERSWKKAIISKTLRLFYLPILLVVIIAIAISLMDGDKCILLTKLVNL
ncbi:hypothetical protein [Neobacillus sp. DY30]|uniref:hypothetical protein n=1 Tax=Neobacillus sp. DY30 TaxID=3047871 RepID=UPI0024BF238B|nr:hypothetical protein [Neobacillus sp. DY30]WHY03393.1 hypothetical protein QNH29_14765 [Neobacillus sp. DY30]